MNSFVFFFFFLKEEDEYGFFFFFQAEDGIRDADVTGVQTCALPISWETDKGAGISEATAQRVDDEVRDLVMKGYETARQIIAKNRNAVRAMAEELLVVESLDAEGIKAVIAN